jgi:hypothetical protein
MLKTTKVLALLVAVVFTLTGCVGGNTYNAPEIDKSNITALENDAYTFYYPSNYGPQEGPQVELMYVNSELNALEGNNSINLTIAKDSGVIKKQSQEECLEFAKEVYTQYGELADLDTIKADTFDYGNIYGCKTRVNLVVADFTIVSEAQVFVKKGSTDSYIVTVSYSEEASDEEVASLRNASQAFFVK